MKKLIIIIFSITFVFAEMGDVIHTIPTPGYYSNGLAWDGNNLWVVNIADADHSDNYWYRIFQISPEDGEILSSFSTNPYFYHGLTFDGEYLWGEHNYTSIERLTVLGESLQQFSAIPLGVGLAFDQFNNILFQSSTQPGAIYKINVTTEELIGELHPDEPFEHGWGDLAFDGNYLWHINLASDTVYNIDQYSGEIINSFPAPSGQCSGLTFDGEYLWISDTTLDLIYQVDIEFDTGNNSNCDLNGDGLINILDLLFVVNCILGTGYCDSNCMDYNNDSSINIFDIMILVNIILN